MIRRIRGGIAYRHALKALRDGTRPVLLDQMAFGNAVLVAVKVAALTLFIVLAIPVMNAENFEPFAPLGFVPREREPAPDLELRGEEIGRVQPVERHAAAGHFQWEPRPGPVSAAAHRTGVVVGAKRR